MKITAKICLALCACLLIQLSTSKRLHRGLQAAAVDADKAAGAVADAAVKKVAGAVAGAVVDSALKSVADTGKDLPKGTGESDTKKVIDHIIAGNPVAGPGSKAPLKLTGTERWIYAGVWVLLGLPLCMYGMRFWPIFGWIVGALAGLNLGNYLELLLATKVPMTNTWTWVMLVVTVTLAIAGAFLFACCDGCLGAILGGYLGFIASNSVISCIASYDEGEAMSWWGQLIVFVCCIGVGMIIGCLLKDYMKLVGSSVVGGWTFVAGVGLFAGQFPYDYNTPAQGAQATWVWWTYMMAACAVMAFGCVWQCCDKVNKSKGFGSKNRDAVNA